MKTHSKSLLTLVLSAAMVAPVFAAPNITQLSQYIETEICLGEDGEGCAEISTFDATSSRVFTTNAANNKLRILNVDSNGQLSEQASIDLSPYGAGPNSVAVSNGSVAVAMEANVKQNNGKVVIFNTDGGFQRSITAGALPDMVTFTPNGSFLLVANEGEPNDNYTIDPEGSITVINTSSWSARTANFHKFNNTKLKDVRVFGPNASVSQDLEPEFITVSNDSTTAWVTLQENNAIAKLDIASATITDVTGLGYKKHRQARNGFDASNEDGGINIQAQSTLGMYQPDAIASFQRGNSTFLLTANEGDARDYDGYSEEVRVKDLTLDPKAYPNAVELQQKPVLGRLKTTTATGDIDGDGDIDQIYSYGARSFSVWNSNAKLVADSGAQFEEYLAVYELKDGINDGDFWVEKRSDDKGPEPESITVGELAGEHYAFIGLERASGIFIYNISSPYKPKAVGYINIKELNEEAPEGLKFIPRDANTGWLLVTSEVSNTTSIYEITID